MRADVLKRFAINTRRVYTGGLSGGARVAMKVALEEKGIAGVFASSAGFPGEPRANLEFPVFGTAGTEDFNYTEMQQLDRAVASPHRVVVFVGGHAWLPSSLAIQAVEWMELEAMKSGLRKRDDGLIARIFAAREAEAAAAASDPDAWLALTRLAADFQGLRDVMKVKARVDSLRRNKSVVDEVARQRSEMDSEMRANAEICNLESGLEGDREVRGRAITQLQGRFVTLQRQATAASDTPERRMARRILSGVLAGARGLGDDEYLKLVEGFRPPAAPQ
jgi:hypothetical protein